MNLTSRYTGSAGELHHRHRRVQLGLEEPVRRPGRRLLRRRGSCEGCAAHQHDQHLDNVVEGVTIDLAGTSDEPVEVVVNRNTGARRRRQRLLSRPSTASSRRWASSTPTTRKPNAALCSATPRSPTSGALYRAIQANPQAVDGQFQFLFQVGVRVGEVLLELDRDKFRQALETDFDNVAELFSCLRTRPASPSRSLQARSSSPTRTHNQPRRRRADQTAGRELHELDRRPAQTQGREPARSDRPAGEADRAVRHPPNGARPPRIAVHRHGAGPSPSPEPAVRPQPRLMTLTQELADRTFEPTIWKFHVRSAVIGLRRTGGRR